jgi:5'-3' exonuclease
MKADRILLIDGLNYCWRANIAFKPEEDKEDKPSYVMVYNFFRNLRATLEEFKPDKVFFCLEGSDNFRYNLFSEYKANRIIKTGSVDEKTNEEFHRQKNIILDLLRRLPIIIVRSDKFECDDVIATLAEDLKDEEVIIISNDSDFIQLLQKGHKNLKIYNPFKKEYMVAPNYHYLTWKSLAGDKKTDNIPGLVGPKKAEKLATDIEKFAEFMDSHENKANYSLNKELIELKIIPGEALQFIDYDIDYEYLRGQFSKMDFKSMIDETYWDRFCETFKNLR